jgi:tetratricopeptide (TPR) repeat protein
MERQYDNKYTQVRQFKDTYASDEIVGYIEKYKLFLIAALLDDNFFKEVKEWYRGILEYVGEVRDDENDAEQDNRAVRIGRFAESAREIVICTILFPSGEDKYNNWESYSRMKIDYNRVAADRSGGNTGPGDAECQRIIDFYNQAIKSGHENSSAYNSCGIAYALKGDFDSAENCFNKALELGHNSRDTYYNRGLIFCKSGRFKEAIDDFKAARDKAIVDKNIEIIDDASYHLGLLYIALGDIQSGASYLQDIKDKPDYEEAALILKELAKGGLL